MGVAPQGGPTAKNVTIHFQIFPGIRPDLIGFGTPPQTSDPPPRTPKGGGSEGRDGVETEPAVDETQSRPSRRGDTAWTDGSESLNLEDASGGGHGGGGGGVFSFEGFLPSLPRDDFGRKNTTLKNARFPIYFVLIPS